jgi:hypothetical protein
MRGFNHVAFPLTRADHVSCTAVTLPPVKTAFPDRLPCALGVPSALADGATVLVSANLGGTESGNQASCCPVISANGRFVAFYSFAKVPFRIVMNEINIYLSVQTVSLAN